jgi:cytochrome b subunit of formate dehydrogenase
MFFILIIVVGLVAWALHLMQEALQRREFSLMLAGFLVSTSAAALVAVYFLMGHYVGYMTEMSERVSLSNQPGLNADWFPSDPVWYEDVTDTSGNFTEGRLP